jgi:hypothetical protein
MKMANYPRQFGLVLILACTLGAALAHSPSPPLRVPTVILVDSDGMALTNAIVGLNLAEFYNLYLEPAVDAARLQLCAPTR